MSVIKVLFLWDVAERARHNKSSCVLLIRPIAFEAQPLFLVLVQHYIGLCILMLNIHITCEQICEISHDGPTSKPKLLIRILSYKMHLKWLLGYNRLNAGTISLMFISLIILDIQRGLHLHLDTK